MNMRRNYSKMQSFMAKNAPTKLTVDELNKESEQLFEHRTAEEDKLVDSYKAKKLTTKATIRKARKIVNQREKASGKTPKAE
jgi:hypothetical protein